MIPTEIEAKVLELIQTISQSGLDVCKPPIPVEEIAERYFGLCIVHAMTSNGKVSGMIQLAQKRIVINSKEPSYRRRFSIAHEIGHWFLHAQQHNGKIVFRTRKSSDRIEAEANAFAGALLMPSKLLYDALLRNLSSIAAFQTGWLRELLDLLPCSEYRVFNRLLFSQFLQNKKSGPSKKSEWANSLVSLIPKMAEEFKVSKEALSVRMQILGLLKPIYEEPNVGKCN